MPPTLTARPSVMPLIASMASLISFTAYLSMRFHFARAYFLVFTGANLGFLAVLIGAYLVLWGK